MTKRARRSEASPTRKRDGHRSSTAPEHPLLRLQQTAGNQAVAQLARQPKAPEKTAAGELTLEIEGIGTLKATGFSLGERMTVNVTAETGELTPLLMRYSSEGKQIPKIVLSAGAATFTFTQVYVANVSTGSSVDSFTFSYGALDTKFLEADAISGA